MKNYGKEVILDLHNCDESKFTKESIEEYFIQLCDKIDMQREKLMWWDELKLSDETKDMEEHLIGISAVQFIRTSNITLHSLDVMRRVYLNIFSCKDFDERVVRDYTTSYFSGTVINYVVMNRI